VAENPTNLHHIRSNEPDLLPKYPVHFASQEVPTPGIEHMARTGTVRQLVRKTSRSPLTVTSHYV
jgi:hypothetical protein